MSVEKNQAGDMNKTLIGKVEKVREHFGEGKVKWLVEELGLNEGGVQMKKFVETLEGVRSKKVGGRDLQELGRLVRVLDEIEKVLRNWEELDVEWRYVGEGRRLLKEIEGEYELVKGGVKKVQVAGEVFDMLEIMGWHIEKRQVVIQIFELYDKL